jgi:hypothetical protein
MEEHIGENANNGKLPRIGRKNDYQKNCWDYLGHPSLASQN